MHHTRTIAEHDQLAGIVSDGVAPPCRELRRLKEAGPFKGTNQPLFSRRGPLSVFRSLPVARAALLSEAPLKKGRSGDDCQRYHKSRMPCWLGPGAWPAVRPRARPLRERLPNMPLRCSENLNLPSRPDLLPLFEMKAKARHGLDRFIYL
jgi:hypothetical protein